MNWRIVKSERGSPPELHQCVDQRLAPVGMYRVRAGKWQHRTGYGEVWSRCERPVGAPDDVVLQLEADPYRPL